MGVALAVSPVPLTRSLVVIGPIKDLIKDLVADLARVDSTRVASTRVDSTKVDLTRVDSIRADLAREDLDRVDLSNLSNLLFNKRVVVVGAVPLRVRHTAVRVAMRL